ncbi:MAG: hypothetical protein FWF94_00195 [Oscillospiraceae bacterium]|nr:hypothetical protein [Oscillospiraceae bacterium]
MDYYKIGFTRLGGQGIKDGWQAVDIPPEIPPEIISKYAALQNANTPPAPVFDVEDNDEKTVIELQSDNRNTYLSRIKYGFADEQGRPSMLAKSFIFDVKQFAEAPEEAIRYVLPEQEELDNRPVFADSDKIALLLKCVYSVMTSRAKETLHLVMPDKSQKAIAATMSLIYSLLFLPFRRLLSFSTYEAENFTPKTIIIDRRLPEFVNDSLPDDKRYKYFDLATGETNISDLTLRKFSVYGFIDEIAETPKMANLNYFKSFESDLREYGCTESTSLNLYKLVYEAENIDRILEGDIDDILKKLNELLSINPPNRTLLDAQILKVIFKLSEKTKFPLCDVLNDILIRKLALLSSETDNDLLKALCDFGTYTSIRDKTSNVCPADGVTSFVEGAGEMTFVITTEQLSEQQPVEITGDFTDGEYEEYGEELPSSNPIKGFIKRFSRK